MLTFDVHTAETAPEKSKPVLNALKKSVGVIPNLAGAMATSPPLIEGFATLRTIFQNGSFTAGEKEVISLTNAVENNCAYCVAIHSTFALNAGVDAQTVNALRSHTLPTDIRMAALALFCQNLIRTRGQISNKDLSAFVEAGFSKDQTLEVLVGIAGSVLANYARHITNAPLDDMLQAQSWTPA